MVRGRGPHRSERHVRRTTVRRSSPPLRTAQTVAAILMVACLTGIVAVSVAPPFAARTLEINGATFTSQTIVRSILGMDETPNVFRIETDRAAEKLARLPAVRWASVEVRLPSTVVVTIVEREPKLVWAIGDNRFVVDQDGLLFGLVDSAGNPIASSAGPLATPNPGAISSAAPASPTPVPTVSESPGATPEAPATPSKSPTKAPATPSKSPTKAPAKPTSTSSGSPSGSPAPTYDASLMPSLAPAPTTDPAATSGMGALGLQVVFDRRASDAGLSLGGIIDPVSLDAGYRLAGLTPTDVGSKAAALAVVLDDIHGFTVSSVPTGWVADFGFYTPSARKVTVIPNQVRDLRSALLKWGEARVAWVFLVSDISEGHVDTVILREGS
jgi:hypothetical protein